MVKRWTVGFFLSFLLVASQASATYVVIENITSTAPAFGGCACYQASGWVGGMVLDFTVDGEAFTLASTDSGWVRSGNAFILDLSKTKPLAPGASLTSKKIVGLPDAGFHFGSRGANVGVYYCEACQDLCGGYSTGFTSASERGLDVVPGLAGQDSFDFQVWGPNGDVYSVVRVTFYPGAPPAAPRRGKNK